MWGRHNGKHTQLYILNSLESELWFTDKFVCVCEYVHACDLTLTTYMHVNVYISH